MKRARRSLSSLRASLRLGLLLLALAAGTLLVRGAGLAPAWWGQRGVLDNLQPVDDYAVANQGQLKNLATKAYDELQDRLASIGGAGSMAAPDGTGYRLSQLIQGFEARRTNPTPQTDDYAAVNLGQLKSVAQPFYDRLIGIGFATQYPWTAATTDDDDFAVANLGQLKRVFAFDLSTFNVARVDSDGDGMTDLWELANGFDPASPADATADIDGDGWTNLEEYRMDTNPRGNTVKVTITAPTGASFVPGY